ncbi:MAG: amidohydrolase family protein, partial [Candidatus Heimdallarchaeota archaeon]
LTIDAAYGTFQEDIKGSIKEGKLADLIVLSENPLTIDESRLEDITVLMTMIGGIVEYCAPNQDILCTETLVTSTPTSTIPMSTTSSQTSTDDTSVAQTTSSTTEKTSTSTTSVSFVYLLLSFFTIMIARMKK